MHGQRRKHRRSRALDFRRGLASYTPESRLAVGGMAEVWRGQATFEDGQVLPVAIKRVRPKLAAHAAYREMFRDEARLGMLLRHDNIVRVYDGREVQGTYIIIMELVQGASLRDLVLGCFETQRPLPLEAALEIGLGLAEALRYAHNAFDDWGRSLDIVHRDVSPHNVLLGDDGAVKLMDFGLAFAKANDAQRPKEEVGGKLDYLAPELVEQGEATPMVDVFALGVTLWEALAGRRLFRGRDDAQTVARLVACDVPSICQLNPQVPDFFGEVVSAALARKPERRPTADELADALEEVRQRMGLDCGGHYVRALMQSRVQGGSRRRVRPA